jgi:hypothetical protein
MTEKVKNIKKFFFVKDIPQNAPDKYIPKRNTIMSSIMEKIFSVK